MFSILGCLKEEIGDREEGMRSNHFSFVAVFIDDCFLCGGGGGGGGSGGGC